MTPGTIIQAKTLYFLVLYPIKNNIKIPCVALSTEPYDSGVIDIVLSNKGQYYLLPAVAMIKKTTLEEMKTIANADQDQLKAIAHSPSVVSQIQYIMKQNQ